MSSITSNSASFSWSADTGLVGYLYAISRSSVSPDSGWTITTSSGIKVNGLSPGTTYYFHVKDSCGNGLSSAAASIAYFTTPCIISQQGTGPCSFDVAASPNPVTQGLTILVSEGGQNGAIRLTDVSGKVLIKTDLIGTSVSVDMDYFPAGVYFLMYEDSSHRKVIKVNKL